MNRFIFILSFLFSLSSVASISSGTIYFENSINLEGNLFKKQLRKTLAQSYEALEYLRAEKSVFFELYLERKNDDFFIQDQYCKFKAENFSDEGPASIFINIEHIWPRTFFNSHYKYNDQVSDLHNLMPVHHHANSNRNHMPFGQIAKAKKKAFKKCSKSFIGEVSNDLILPHSDFTLYFEPADDVKGDVARAMFYFSIRYNLRLDSTQEHFLKIWHKEDPVSEKERQRNNKIQELQKTRNPFIDFPSWVDRVPNF